MLGSQAQLVGDTAPLGPGWHHWVSTIWSKKNKPQESQVTEQVTLLDSFKLSPRLTPREFYLVKRCHKVASAMMVSGFFVLFFSK